MGYSTEALADPAAAIAAIRARLRGVDAARALLAELDASDPAARVAATVADLEASWVALDRPELLAPGARGRPTSLLKIYFAGSEIEPWYPQIWWLDAWLERADGKPLRNASSVGGGDLVAVAPLAGAVETIDEVDPDLGDELRELFVLTAWSDLVAALEPALESPAFARLSIAPGFRVVATPGHDEPWIELAHRPR